MITEEVEKEALVVKEVPKDIFASGLPWPLPRGGVKLDNSPAWDRNLTVRVDFATSTRAWDRGLTLRVIPVTTISEVALGTGDSSRGARGRCASMTWGDPVTQGLPGKRQLTKLLMLV